MQTEKCFCHFNGYEVKDAKARKNITKLESDIIEVNENANILDTKIEQNKGSINLINEEIANIKNSVASNVYDIGVIATNTANANANIINLESDITSLNNNLNQANENITNNSNNITTLTDTVNNIHTHDNKDILDSITPELFEYMNMSEDKYRLNEEIITNKTWIDGKQIYRRVIIGTTISTLETWNKIADVEFDEIVSMQGVVTSVNENYPSNESNIAIIARKNLNQVCEKHFNEFWSNKQYKVILEYTKTTDEVESEV